MSGHSKFANIKHKKEKNDAKKGKIFTVIGREIVMAVKAGGPDPNNNSKLRDVIAKAKANNMPNDTIDRGIKKAAGADSADSYEKAVYEGYGPNGVAIIVETLQIIRTVLQVTYVTLLPRVTEASELRDVYPLCSIRKARSSSTRKSLRMSAARWMRTS